MAPSTQHGNLDPESPDRHSDPAGPDGRDLLPARGNRMTQTFRGMMVRFWRSDAGLSAFLTLLVVSVLVLPPLVAVWSWGRILDDIAFSLLLLGGIVAASERIRTMLAIAVVIVIALALHWTARHTSSIILVQLQALFLILSFGMLTLVVLGQVFRDGPVTSHRIQGAIAAYLLLGVTWAAAYKLVALLFPDAFTGPILTEGSLAKGWLYFSYATLSTVGYGDIVPVHPIARSLAVMEALVGQLYPAILIARLVSQEVQDRNRDRQD